MGLFLILFAFEKINVYFLLLLEKCKTNYKLSFSPVLLSREQTGKGICHNFRFYFPAISEPPVLMCLEV